MIANSKKVLFLQPLLLGSKFFNIGEVPEW